MLVLKIAGGIILAVLLLAVGCSVLVTASEDEIGAEFARAEEEFAASVAAEEEERAASIEWEWVEDPDCDSGTRCWQIAVSSADGCPDGVYAELNVLDENDAVIDYTNDTLGVLQPGQTAILTFDYYGDGAESGQVAKVDCQSYG